MPQKLTLKVHVKPNSSRLEVRRISPTEFTVRLTAAPEKGCANEQLIEVLAEHFRVPKRSVTILHGASARDKVVEVMVY